MKWVLGIGLALLLCCGGGGGVGGYFAYSKFAEAAQRQAIQTQGRLLVFGIQNYDDSNNRLPAHASYSPEGKPLLSWRVHLLPYIEQQHLYERFHLDEPWDSPHNSALIDEMPREFKLAGRELEPGKTCFVVPYSTQLDGPTTAFPKARFPGEIGIDGRGRAELFSMTPDGSSMTIGLLVVPASQAVVWTEPDDFDIDASSLESLFEGKQTLTVIMLDGSSRSLPSSIDRTVLRNLMLANDGNVIPYFEE